MLLLLSLRYGIRTSPAQFFFYFFSLITGAATLRSIIFRKMESDSNDNYEPIDDNETYYADYIELDTVHCNCWFAEISAISEGPSDFQKKCKINLPRELVHFVLANPHLQWTVSVHISHITIVTIVIQMRLINYFIFMQFNMVCTFWCSFLIASLMSNLKNMMNESESWRIPALNWKLLIFHVYFISGVILYCGLDLENLW